MRARRGSRGLQVLEVAPHLGMALIFDRTNAGVTGRPLGAARELGGHEFGEADPIAAKPHGLVEFVRLRLEAGQAIEDVVGPAGFAELAVIDDVDAGFHLPGNHVGDGALEGLLISRVVLLAGVQQSLGTHDAADMGGEDAILAAFHRVVSLARVPEK